MLEEFCRQLKEKRKELGYNIEDVVEHTKIYPVAIRDIEDGNFENISPIYLKGFLKIYASFLGVDATQALKEVALVKPKPKSSLFRKVKPGSLPQKYVSVPASDQERRNAAGQISDSEKTQLPPGEKKGRLPFSLPSPEAKKLAVLLFMVFVLLAGIISFGRYIVKTKENRKRKQSAAARLVERDRETVKVIDGGGKKKGVRDKTKKSRQGKAARKKYKKEINETAASPTVNLPKDFAKTAEMRVSLTAKKNCFIRVKSDNKLLFEGILKKGVVESWRGHKIIELKVSDGSALYIELNGRPLPVLTAMRKPIKSLKITPVGISVDK